MANEEKEELKAALKALGLKDEEATEIIGSNTEEPSSEGGENPKGKKEKKRWRRKEKKEEKGKRAEKVAEEMEKKKATETPNSLQQKQSEPMQESIAEFSKKIEKETMLTASEVQPLMLVVAINPVDDEEIITYIQDKVPHGRRALWVKEAIKTAIKLELSGGVLGSGGEQMVIQSFLGQVASMMSQRIQAGVGVSSPVRTSSGPAPALKKVEGRPKGDYKPERPPLDEAVDSVIVG